MWDQAREKLASQLCADRISVPSVYVFSQFRFVTICILFIPGKYLLKIEKFGLGVLSAHFTSIIKKGSSSLMTKKGEKAEMMADGRDVVDFHELDPVWSLYGLRLWYGRGRNTHAARKPSR